MGQFVIFGTGVGEDVDEGARQGDLQCDLNGADAHLRTVATPLGDKERRKCSFESSLSFSAHLITVELDQLDTRQRVWPPFSFVSPSS